METLNGYFLQAAVTVPIGVFLALFAAAIGYHQERERNRSSGSNLAGSRLGALRHRMIVTGMFAALTVPIALFGEVLTQVNQPTQSLTFVIQSQHVAYSLIVLLTLQLMLLWGVLQDLLLVPEDEKPDGSLTENKVGPESAPGNPGASSSVASQDGHAKNGVGSFFWRLPTPLKFVFWGGVAVVVYGIFTYIVGVAEGIGPAHISVHGASLPLFDPATTAAVLLAFGTIALAYSALRQAQSTETMLFTIKDQELAASKSADAAELQVQVMQRQLAVMENQARISEASRRESTFPRLNIVTAKPGTSEQVSLIPGSSYPQLDRPTPILGIENTGNGTATLVRVSASWKLYGFNEAKSASPADLLSIPWSPVPVPIPPIDRIGPHEVHWIDATRFNIALVLGSQLQSRTVALCVRVAWIDPDDERIEIRGGLSLIGGTFRQLSDGSFRAVFIALGQQDKPSDLEYSPYPPNIV